MLNNSTKLHVNSTSVLLNLKATIAAQTYEMASKRDFVTTIVAVTFADTTIFTLLPIYQCH